MNSNSDRVLVVGGARPWLDNLSSELALGIEIRQVAEVETILEEADGLAGYSLVVLVEPGDDFPMGRVYKTACNHTTEPPDFLTLTANCQLPEYRDIPPDLLDAIPMEYGIAAARIRLEHLLEMRRTRHHLRQRALEMREKLEHSNIALVETLLRASAYKDDEYGRHVQRINEYSTLLARLLRLPEEHCKTLGVASMLHDLGKMSIPDSILQKPGKLDAEEWEIVKHHCEEGAHILGDPDDSRLLELTRSIILTHHEKWDGSGYPARLAGRAIPLEGRIVALADVLDALTTDLPYKKAWSMTEATHYIHSQSGEHFDPELVGLFLENVEQFIDIRNRLADILVEEEEVADRR